MKTKHLAILLALLVLIVTLTGCTQEDETPTAASNYEKAITLLQEGNYTEASEAFTALGHYYDASRYAMYSNALASAESGNYILAASSMQALSGFMDSSILSAYYTGRAYEEAEEYESALEQYATILQYGDASARALAIPGKSKERDYKAACALEQAGKYSVAISAFIALNGYSDSEAHIASILQKQTEQANADAYASAAALETTGKLEEAAAAFRVLGDYSDSADRVIAIEGKILERDYQAAVQYEQNDDLVTAYQMYVTLGDYQDAAGRAAAIKDGATYRSAMAMVDNGQYTSAREAFAGLADYKDSAEKARLLGVCGIATNTKYLNNGVVGFMLQDLWGYIDLNNNYDVAPAYNSIARFNSTTNLSIVSVDSRGTTYYGLINRAGQVVSTNSYIDIKEGENGLYTAVNKGGKYAYDFILIGSNGSELSTWRTLGNAYNSDSSSKYNSYKLYGPSFTNGVMIAMDSNGYYSLLNTNGEIVIQSAQEISLINRNASNDTALVKWGKNKYQLMALDGTALDENTWASVRSFRNGYAAVCNSNGLWGYISQTDCHVAIEPQYQAVNDFSGGYAAVEVNNMWGFIDAQNNMVIQPQYYEVASFRNGCVAVRAYNVGWQVIDETGKLLYFKQNAYLAADAMDQNGYYEAAIAAFEGLDGYADSEDRALQSREKINATVYATAEQYEAAGEYIKAAETFEWLGDYSDAPARAAAARETQNANTYATALLYEENGKLEEAIAVYLTLGDYNGSAQHAADLRESINQGICAQADELETAEKFEEAIVVLNQIPEYTGVAEHVTALEEKIRVRDYNAAAALEDAGMFEEAIVAFTAMVDYSDSADRIVTIRGKILEREYNAAAALEENGKFEEAIVAFTALADYSDSVDRIVTIQGKILERDYNAAAALEDEGKYEEAIVAFTALGDYSDSADRIVTIQGKIQQREYNAAAALEENGNYAKAYDAFYALGTYSDSADRAIAVAEKAAEQQRQMAYAAAATAEENNELETAEAGFTALGDYSDAPARVIAVREKIRARDYAAAVTAMKSEDYATAVSLFTALGNYQDSTDQLAQSQTGLQYQSALADALAGKLTQAYNAFVALGDYKDSAKKAEICGNVSRASKTQQIIEGVLIYEFHELWGIANLNTNVITAAKYTSITYDKGSKYSSYGLLKVFVRGGTVKSSSYSHPLDTYGYTDFNGKEVIGCSYSRITDFNADGLCSIAQLTQEKSYGYYYAHYLYGIINYQGTIVTKPQWRTMGTNNSWTGTTSAEYWKDSLCSIGTPAFANGRMKVQNADGLWGYINESGQILGSVKWYSIGEFKNGMAMVQDKQTVGSGWNASTVDKYGFINEQGQTIGEVRWDKVNNFSYDYAAVQENGYWGFINRNNELVIPCRYTEVASFKEDGTCDVKTKQGTWQVINTKGEVSFF